jgi:hypothetical protein
MDIGLTAGSLNVTGASVQHGGITAGSLYVTGPSVMNIGLTAGSLNVTGASVQHGGITAGALYITGASIMDIGLTAGSLNVTGSSILADAIITNATSTNLVNTSMTSAAAFITDAKITNLTASGANITDATVGSLAITNIIASNITSSNIVCNTRDITPSMGDIVKEVSYSASNGVSSTAITGFAFGNATVRAFNALASVAIIKTSGTNLYANYELKGLQKDTGSWTINSSYIGDNTGIVFTIDNSGQIKYTSSSIGNFSTSTIKFKANTTTL